jgi:uncharacterized RDD family membrane protein YckC
MALLLDSLLQTILVIALYVIALVVAGSVSGFIVVSIASLFAVVGYDVLFEVFGGGRTLGKRAASLRVVMDGGAPIGLRASLIRNVLRLIEGTATAYIPAMISILVTKHNQRLGDLAAGTLVIRDSSRAPPVPQVRAVDPAVYASWDVAGIGDAELSAVRSFIARRDQLAPYARRALASQLAERLRPTVAGVRDGLSDEAFLEQLAAAKASRR